MRAGLDWLHHIFYEVFLKVHLQDSVDIVIEKKAFINTVILALDNQVVYSPYNLADNLDLLASLLSVRILQLAYRWLNDSY